MPLRRRSRRRAGLSLDERTELDELARAVVLARAGATLLVGVDGRWSWHGACERCHRPGWLYWCHVFTRSIFAVRWDPENALALCAGCHRFLDQHWHVKRDFAIEKLGAVGFDRLQMRARAGRFLDNKAPRLILLRMWTKLSSGLADEQRARFFA